MSFWQPVAVLLRVRLQVARNALAQNATAFMATVVFACLLALAALSMGNRLGALWPTLTAASAESRLLQIWMLMQVMWLLALLLPGSLTLFGAPAPAAVLRPFALRPVQALVAETLAGLLDIPGLLALVLTLPLVVHLMAQGQWGQALVTLPAFALLSLQTGILARLLAYSAASCARRLRRWAEVPAWTALLLISLCVGMPPAFASLSNPPKHSEAASAIRPPLSALNLIQAMPAGLAAHAVVSVRRADMVGLAGALGGLSIWIALSWCGSLLALGGATALQAAHEGRAGPRAREQTAQRTGSTSVGALAQLRALILTEWLLLLRKPQGYLPLRQPAAMLMLGAFAFVAPDMGRDPVYNLKELLGIGTLLYSVLWQLQLLCNRFGSEAGTGALLFSLSIPRWRLLLGKNLALFSILLLLDGAEGIGLRVVAEMPLYIPAFLIWLPLILLVLTAVGNLVSVAQPFAIARQSRRAGGEPPDALAVIYVLAGCAVPIVLSPISQYVAAGTAGVIAAALYACLFYGVSLFVTAVLLARREQQMIGRLDRNE